MQYLHSYFFSLHLKFYCCGFTDLGSCFHGLPSLFVRKGSTVTYGVQFKGMIEGKTEGSLILKNNKAGEDSFQYRYLENILSYKLRSFLHYSSFY